jgi:uncharacterized protein YgbK (DUF1537 family)
MNAQLLIVADDLSGTADCAVASVRHGLHAAVMLDAESIVSSECDVLAIDVDSRRVSREEAARKNVDAVRLHASKRLYKKIDSTLRGNFAAETAALVPLAGMAIVAPAFPAAGRTTKGGFQWINGVPVEASEVWRNEGIAGRADLVAMLSDAGLRVALLSIDEVRSGLVRAQKDGIQAVVCDAQTAEDLKRIAQASASLDDVFWVGSAGLAPALIEALKLKPLSSHVHRQEVVKGPVLAVIGSMSSISHAQLDTLKSRAGITLLHIELTTHSLSEAQSHITQNVIDALGAGRHVVVSLSQTSRGDVNDGLLFCQRLAALLAPAVQHAGSVIATGGETARALLSAAGVSDLQVIEEIESGVPLLHGVLNDGRVLRVVTKAGGFGTPDTIHTAWRRLADAGRVQPTSKGNHAMTYRPVIGITMPRASAPRSS